jgi:hypothetical protein
MPFSSCSNYLPGNATQSAGWLALPLPTSSGDGVSFMPSPGRGGKLLWAVIICFGWLLIDQSALLGQSPSRPGTAKPDAKMAPSTKPAIDTPAANARAANAKAQPGKGKPVSTKGEAPAKGTETEVKPSPVKEADKNKDSTRWREGHRIESATVTFQISETERFQAALSSEKGLTALENLALERIADAMRVDSADNRWVVTGRVTEFRGQNYLWIERATRAAKIAGQ